MKKDTEKYPFFINSSLISAYTISMDYFFGYCCFFYHKLYNINKRIGKLRFVLMNSKENEYLFFISNSSQDQYIADALFLFLNNVGIEYKQIFNFQVLGQIPAGDRFHDRIRSALINTKGVCIFIISNRTLESGYCFYEMGAAWALGIKSILIYVDPVDHNHVRLNNLPFSDLQAILLKPDDRENVGRFIDLFQVSIRALFPNLESKFEGISFLATKDLLLRQLSRPVAAEAIPIELSDGCVFHQNSDPSTLRELDKNNNHVKLFIDFTNSSPQYVGYAVDLDEADWRRFYQKNYSITFDIEASDGIHDVIIELKGAAKQTFATMHTDEYALRKNHCAFPLQQMAGEKRFKLMTELVFLWKPVYVDGKGSVRISNLKLQHADESSDAME